MRVSVVICTWNRCELLRSTLESMRTVTVPADLEWELVVVNNNSPDATDEVITDFQGLLPVRRVFENELGVSRARNAGVHASTGQLLLFTDDDVRFDPDWMLAYFEAVKRWPDASFFGGMILPWFTAEVPHWVKKNQTALRGMLCLIDLGMVSRKFRPEEFPYGPNMAVRREALAKASFDERVGRKGYEQLRDSERSLFLSLKQQDLSGVWVPDAKVYHFIPRRRATLSYLWNYYRGRGRSQVRLGRAREQHSAWHLWTAGMRALTDLGRRPSNWATHLSAIAFASGQYSESNSARTTLRSN